MFPLKINIKFVNVFAIQSIGENVKSYILKEFLQFNTTHTVLPISIEKSFYRKGPLPQAPNYRQKCFILGLEITIYYSLHFYTLPSSPTRQLR